MNNRVISLTLPLSRKDPPHISSERASSRTDKLVESFSASRRLDASSMSHVSSIDLEQTPKSKPLLQELSRKEKQIEELMLKNISLNKTIAKLQIEKEELATSLSPSRLDTDILKYSNFIAQGISNTPKLKDLVSDRISSFSDFINKIERNKDQCLLQTLQVISDLMVQESEDEDQSLIAQRSNSFVAKDRDNQHENDITHKSDPMATQDCFNSDTQQLFQVINSQADRINRLNRQIFEAVNTSKELLKSPLAKSKNLLKSIPSKKIHFK